MWTLYNSKFIKSKALNEYFPTAAPFETRLPCIPRKKWVKVKQLAGIIGFSIELICK